MAIENINNQESGLSARNKINESFQQANEVANKVDKIPTAVVGNTAVWGPGGVLLDSGQKPGGGESINVPGWDENVAYPLNFVVQENGLLFASKVADNLGNQPPESGENDFWREVSQSESSGTPLWAAGLYTEIRARVFRIESGVIVEYVLTVAENELPFESTDFAAELAAGQWQQLGGGGGSSERPITSQSISNNGSYNVDFADSIVRRLNVAAGATAITLGVTGLTGITVERKTKVIIDNSATGAVGLTVTFNDQSSAINFNAPLNDFPGVYPAMNVPDGQIWEVEFENESATDVAIYFARKEAL